MMLPVLAMTYRFNLPLSTGKLFGFFTRHLSNNETTHMVEVSVPNFCIDCKHFLPYGGESSYGKCRAFPKTNEMFRKAESDYMVSGVQPNVTLDYYYCSTARESEKMCDKSGRLFQAKQ